MITACIKEFCKEILKTYINRTFRIVNRTTSREDLKSTLIHICCSRGMKRNKINFLKLLECKQLKQKNEIKEFYMLWFSCLVECRYLSEAKEFVMHGFTVLTS